ncbi:MAG: glycoside hydrolase, partial [Myxococcales bacterium]|nr:glycoside hydrolase [Myxococcales bacterium]
MKKRNLSWTALALLALMLAAADAATPDHGTVSVASPQLSYTGGPFYTPNATDSSTGVTCDAADPCDQFALTVDLPADYATTHPNDQLRIEVGWNDPTNVQDLDVYVADASGQYTGKNTDTSNPEVIVMPAGSGKRTYTIQVSPSLTTAQAFTTSVALLAAAGPPPPPPQPPPPDVIAPRYYNYAPSAGIGENSGEPSIGYNLKTHRAMYIAGLQTLRATFPENLPPQGATPESCDAQWDDVSTIVTKTKSVDPILFTDQRTGRTFVSQLNSLTQTASAGVLVGLNSLFAFTDTDGEGGNTGWTPGQINPPDGSYDHQTVGAGPYPSPIPPGINPIYPDAVYYCSQAGVTAFCSRSDDGGLNFGRSTPIYNVVTDGCGGIHGHVKVAPDGTVYVPNRGCSGSQQAVTVSTDAGTTWTVRRIPQSSPPPGILDPSVGIASDGTLYFAYVASDGHAHAAVSHDKGVTWINDYDLGVQVGVQNSVFIESVAGDPDRAAVGFIGTTTAGDHQADAFKGTWYAFISTTYDGGHSWITVNATPNDPVQREAAIWNGGGNNPFRNLLDFNEITIDERGRVLYAYADGCIGDCAAGGVNSFSAKATIARQSGGMGLLAAFDPAEPRTPDRACLSGRRDDMASYLRWRTPDTGGAAISAYKVYRDGALIGSQTGGKTTYTDRAVNAAVSSYTYEIVAANAQGDGLASNRVQLPVTPRVEPTGACALPGVQVITDPAGNATDGLAAHDITSVSVAEPQSIYPGSVVITMKVGDLSTVPPGARWAVRFGAPTPPPATATGPSEDYFVAMVSSDGPTPTFTWGTTSVPQNLARVFTTFGSLQSGSNYATDGTITMILDKSVIGNPQPGQALTSMLGSVRLTAPSAVPSAGGTNETIFNSTGGGSYTFRAATLCLPNHAPLAVLNASPQAGPKPLAVQFDGSASSDADSIDTIASYAFNFG